VLDSVSLRWSDDAALTVVMAARGYPGAVERGTEIRGVAEVEAMENVLVFQAGTAIEDDRLVSAGGRVLAVTALGGTVAEAQARAYEAVAKIDWPQGFYRTDIGWREVAREKGPR
jgi:phosphoribosylamine--glycine ligase